MHNYAVDIIRIFAMYGIVCIHYLAHGGFLSNTVVLSMNWNISWLLYSFVQISVNVFVIISGYFLVKSNNFSWRKVFNIWGEVAFYSVTICLVFVFDGTGNWKQLLISFLPVKFAAYWFVPVYIALYILSPYLSKLGNSLSKDEYVRFLCVLIGLFSVYSFYTEPFGKVGGNIVGITWFVTLFFIGGYIGRFNPGEAVRTIHLGGLYFIGTIFLFIIHYAINYLSPVLADKLGERLFFINSPFVLFNSIAFFLFALRAKIDGKYTKKIIRNISALSFAVYLISENSNIYPFLWTDVFQTKRFYDSDQLLLNFLLSTISVYLVCTLIEFVRKKLLFPFWGNIYSFFRNIKEH